MRARSRPGRKSRVLLLVLALSLAAPLAAQPRNLDRGSTLTQPRDRGEFEVRTAALELIDGVYHVDAFVYLRLPTRAIDALHDGLPLTIRFEVEFLRVLRLWFDPTVFPPVSQRWQLSYIPVTDRYVVYNINIQHSRSFMTLAGALQYMGRIDDLYVIDAALLEDDKRYQVRVRAVLDKEELVGPVRLLAFFRPDWSIESEWVEWELPGE